MDEIRKLAEHYGLLKGKGEFQLLSERCPVALVNPQFSPARIVELVDGEPESLIESPLIWQCLICGLCRELTGGGVDMSRFIRDVRILARGTGKTPSEVYGGAIMSIERISKSSQLKQARTGWITKPLNVSFKKGKYLYWVGGAPFFDAIMPDIGKVSLDSARAAILLLNKLGIKPVILENERFSGHDLLWTGDRDGFLEFAGLNIEAIVETGAETVIVSSPHDYHTLSKSYVEHTGKVGFEVRHITEFVAERIDGLKFNPWKKKITYHDPCWLGRGMGIYDAPREILRAIPGVELVEMKNTREHSSCCGTSCWSNCTGYSKLIQINRLKEAVQSGAETLVTACWECEIHFLCTLRPQAWKEVTIEVEDLILRAGSLVI